MDSGNSGSLQSSRELDLASSAEEEYDSRRTSSNPTPNPNPNNPPSLFDSLSNYFDAFPRSPPISNPNLVNLERPWPLLPQNNTISPYNITAGTAAGIGVDPGEISSFHTNPSRVIAGNPDQMPAGTAKTGKKRSRASRRAPTTVLTTDTSNFRAMVQEFTGIPAPPFSASSFSRNPARLDLLGGLKSRMDSQPQQSPSFLLRPFAQKVLSSPSFTTSTTTTTTGNNNHNPSSSLDLHNLSSSSLSPNMANSFLNFQSLLNSTTPKFSVSLPMLGSKLHEFSSLPTTTTVADKLGLMEEFGIGMNSANVNMSQATEMGSAALPNLVSSDMGSLNRTSNNQQSWGDGNGGLNDDDHSYLRSSSSAGNYCNSQRVSSCKLNYAASNTDFHVEKGSENISRGEGMVVDSWLCSSE